MTAEEIWRKEAAGKIYILPQKCPKCGKNLQAVSYFNQAHCPGMCFTRPLRVTKDLEDITADVYAYEIPSVLP